MKLALLALLRHSTELQVVFCQRLLQEANTDIIPPLVSVSPSASITGTASLSVSASFTSASATWAAQFHF